MSLLSPNQVELLAKLVDRSHVLLVIRAGIVTYTVYRYKVDGKKIDKHSAVKIHYATFRALYDRDYVAKSERFADNIFEITDAGIKAFEIATAPTAEPVASETEVA